MAATCTSTTSPNSCGHRHLTIDGLTVVLHETDLVPLSDDERMLLYTLAIRHRGVDLAQLLNRVIVGDEATNVKQYTLIAPGVAIVKTNIGMSYVNVLPEANGGRALVEFTGCTEYRLVLNALLPGNGSYSVKVIRDGDEAILHEAANIPAQAGERELDTDWQPLPNGVNALELVRVQASASVGSNDPTFRRMVLLVR